MASKAVPGSVVRKSWSRPDSSGGRKEIPLTASLEPLSPSSTERPGSSDKSNPGTARARTPVGSAAPRRTASANRASAQVAQQQHQRSEQHGGLPDDDSLVLYKDPSEISAQQSQASVLSGRHQEGETFFTALRQDYSYDSSGSEYETAMEGQDPAGGLSAINSQLNPMQSPNSSAYFSTAEKTDYASAAGSLQEDYSEAASMATYEPSYATAIDAGSASGEAGLVPTASVMDVINSLYGSQAADAKNQQQVQKWHELDENARPLIQPGAAAAAADSQQPLQDERSVISSVGSTGDAVIPDGVQQQQEHELPSAESSAESRSGAVRMQKHTPEPESSSGSFHSAVGDGDLSPEASTSGAAEQQPQQRQQQGDLAEATAPGTPDNEETAGAGDQEHAATYLTEVEGLLEKRTELQAELGGFVQQVTSMSGEDGKQLVDMPADYNLMVERMLRERRSQYQALEGWEGPHRFDELPVAQLPMDHDDPKVAAGLETIRQLDEKLREVWLQALVAARDAAPEQWQEAERQRMERRAAQLDEGLAKERQKRLHAARLLRALKKLDEQGGLTDGKGLNSYSYYQLQPQDEQLLASVLNRDEAALEHDNPFDPSAAVLDNNSMEELEALTAQLVQQSSRCLSAVASSLDKSSSMLLSEYAAAGPADAVDPAAQVAAAGGGGGGVNGAADGQGPAEAGGDYRPSTAGSVRSSISSNRPRHTLAEIDMLLQALQLHGQPQQQPGQLPTAGDKAGQSRLSGLGKSNSSRSMTPGDRRTSHASSASKKPAAVSLPRAASGSTAASVPDSPGGDTSQQQQQQQRDFVREQREVRELAARDREVDAKLRALRTSELQKPSPEQLQALLQQLGALSLQSASSDGAAGVKYT